jgi:hypothetical protein
VLRGHQRPRRGQAQEQDHAQLVGGLGADVTEGAEHLGGVGQGPAHRPAEQHRADRVEPVFEGGGDPEVAPAAPQPPEQLRLGPGVDVEGLAFGGDQVDRAQVVDGQAELAHGVPKATAEGEPADAGVADDPGRGGQPEPLGGPVQLPEQDPAGRPGGTGPRVDPDRLHR